MSDLSMCLKVQRPLISGFGKVGKNRYTEVTCKLQVIYARRKEHNKRQGWERIRRKGVVAPFYQIGKDVTVSRSRTAVFICLILSDLVKGSDNTLTTYPLPSLTLVVLFPSRVYNLQFASNLCISVLPDLPKTGNQRPLYFQTHGEIRHCRKKQQGSRREPCCFAEVRGSAPLRVTFRKGAVLDELTQKTLLAYKNRAAALHRFTHEPDQLLSLSLH